MSPAIRLQHSAGDTLFDQAWILLKIGREASTPLVHPGITEDHTEEGVVWYPSKKTGKVNAPYGSDKEMTEDEIIRNNPMLETADKDFARDYIEHNPFMRIAHLNQSDSRPSPLQLNLQRMTEFDDYDDWNEFDQEDDNSQHKYDEASFLNVPWNQKTDFTRSEPMVFDQAWYLLKDKTKNQEKLPESITQGASIATRPIGDWFKPPAPTKPVDNSKNTSQTTLDEFSEGY